MSNPNSSSNRSRTGKGGKSILSTIKIGLSNETIRRKCAGSNIIEKSPKKKCCCTKCPSARALKADSPWQRGSSPSTPEKGQLSPIRGSTSRPTSARHDPEQGSPFTPKQTSGRPQFHSTLQSGSSGFHPKFPGFSPGLSPTVDKSSIPVAQPFPKADYPEESFELTTFTSGEIPTDELCRSNLIPDRVYKFGERGSGIHTKYPVQDYELIKKECLKKGELFEDISFDTDLSFLGDKQPTVKWLRPKEISSHPVFLGKVSRFNVKQGAMGDCWLLASMAVITLSDQRVAQVIPEGQSFDKDYAGIFHFRLWNYGKWIDVCVDDRLPADSDGLIFTHADDPNEFWTALLEKACAKLKGKYAYLCANLVIYGLETFTGGFAVQYAVKTYKPDYLTKVLDYAHRLNAVMGTSIQPNPEIYEAELANGLIMGHAYSITDVKIMNKTEARDLKTLALLRIRNPWGTAIEWNGAWSDGSAEWQALSEQQKKEMGLKFDHDGEWWMSIEDYQQQYNYLDVCHIMPVSEEFTGMETKWHVEEDSGVWLPGITAGGGIKLVDHPTKPDMYVYRISDEVHLNPQYIIQVEPSDWDDEENVKMIISLYEKEVYERYVYLKSLLIFSIDLKTAPFPLSAEFIQDKLNEIIQTTRKSMVSYERKFTISLDLEPGIYCIIPCCNETQELREYYLRICTEKAAKFQKIDNDIDIDNIVKAKLYAPFWNKDYEQAKDDLLKLYPTLAGQKFELTWPKLQGYLNLYLKAELQEELSRNSCQTIMALFDPDLSGGLSFDEFEKLMKIIIRLKSAFLKYCNDQWMLDPKKLEASLEEAGMVISKDFLVSVAQRFGNEAYEITFDDFLMYSLKFYSFADTFTSLRGDDQIETKALELDKNQWMTFLLYS